MVDIKNKRCACGKRPCFRFPGDRTRTCCFSCKKDGMVYIKNKLKTKLRCACGKRPCFGFPGDMTPTCCSSCKKDGMVDIKHKRCARGKRHSYCLLGDRGKKKVNTSAPEMALARFRAGALPKEQKWCRAARLATASLRSAYVSDVPCAAMHSAGCASSSCAAAAAASLGAAPPAAPPGVESLGFAFSHCAAAGSSGTPALAAAASAATQGVAAFARNNLRGFSQREI